MEKWLVFNLVIKCSRFEFRPGPLCSQPPQTVYSNSKSLSPPRRINGYWQTKLWERGRRNIASRFISQLCNLLTSNHYLKSLTMSRREKEGRRAVLSFSLPDPVLCTPAVLFVLTDREPGMAIAIKVVI